MLSIKDAIPKTLELARRGGKIDAAKVSEFELDQASRELAHAGYLEKNQALYQAIQNYYARELSGLNRKGLFIKGSPGVGKTFGVSILANRFHWPVYAAKDFEHEFLTAPEAEWRGSIEGLDFFGKPSVIVIDDLGTESCPVMRYGTACNLMADVIDHRYRVSFLRHGVRTIVTTNLTDAELSARYGFRINDRLNEMFEFLTVNGGSFR